MKLKLATTIGENSAPVIVDYHMDEAVVLTHDKHSGRDLEEKVSDAQIDAVWFKGVDIFDALTVEQVTELAMECEADWRGDAANADYDAAEAAYEARRAA